MESAEALPSEVTAATVVAVGLIYWLPYFSSSAGYVLVNPVWGIIFGLLPTLMSLMTDSSVATIVTALLWPLVATLLAGAVLWKAAPGVSRIAHLLVWTSLCVIVPHQLATKIHLFEAVGVYKFLSI